MKKTFRAIIALALAALCLFAVSCGKKNEGITVDIKAVDDINGGVEIFSKTIKLEKSTASVMDALIAACEEDGNSVEYDLAENDTLVANIGGLYDPLYAPEGTFEEGSEEYWWSFTVNGKEPTASAVATPVKDGDKIEWHYVIFTEEAE